MCLFVTGFGLSFGCRLAALTIKVAHRFEAVGLGPRIVIGDGVGCLGRKGVGSEQLHKEHQGFGDRFIFGTKHGRHGGRRSVDVGFDAHDCTFGKRGGENVLAESLVGTPVVFV